MLAGITHCVPQSWSAIAGLAPMTMTTLWLLPAINALAPYASTLWYRLAVGAVLTDCRQRISNAFSSLFHTLRGVVLSHPRPRLEDEFQNLAQGAL